MPKITVFCMYLGSEYCHSGTPNWEKKVCDGNCDDDDGDDSGLTAKLKITWN